MLRSVCHKPNYVFITLAHILCYVAAHPVLKRVWEATFSVSTHGRPGSNAFIDRVMEGYQQLQTKRSGLNGASAVESGLCPVLTTPPHLPNCGASWGPGRSYAPRSAA